MRNLLLLLCMGMMMNSLYADPDGFNQGVAAANQAKKYPGFDPKQIPHYGEQPKEMNYYNNPNAMKGDGINVATQDKTAQSAMQTEMSGKLPVINDKTDFVKKANAVIKNASDISHGKSTPDVPCEQQQCKTTWTPVQCSNGGSSGKQITCVSDLTAQVIPTTKTATYDFSLVSGNYATPIRANITPPSGMIIATNLHFTGTSYYNDWTEIHFYLNDQQIGYIHSTGHAWDTWHGDLIQSGLSIKADGKSLFAISVTRNDGSGFNPINLSITLTMQVPSYTVQDIWGGNCDTLAMTCQQQSVLCTQGQATKTINDIPITRDCWQKTYQFICGGSKSKVSSSLLPFCSTYSAQGCQEISRNGDTSTYNCSKQDCSGTINICGKPTFCLDGDCYKGDPSQNKNFGQDASAFAAAAQTSGQVTPDPNAPTIFTGQSMGCFKTILSGILVNCCDPNTAVSSSSCSETEKKLGKANQDGRAIFVGSKCVSQAGICLNEESKYCVFDNLLAYDVEVQGRAKQLSIGFGDYDSPNCRGISVNEMQKIDFSKIDFTNYANTLTNNATFPNSDAVNKKIHNNMCKQTGGC